eukprot:10079297-Lingulodinium_polyedra.AAC.1
MVGGSHLKRAHPLTMLLLTWCRIVSQLRVPVGIHENAIGFDSSVLVSMLGHVYDICELKVSPSDVGFSFMRRPRLYFVLVLVGA